MNLKCTIHNYFFDVFFCPPSLPACLIFSCPSESQPSLKETGDLRAQGEVTCPPAHSPTPTPSFKKEKKSRSLEVLLSAAA